MVESEKLESGELELRKAFEETTTNNVKAMIEHVNESRKMIRELEGKLTKLEEFTRSQDTIINALKLQLAAVQTKVYSGGT